jgi:hypothetical protein
VHDVVDASYGQLWPSMAHWATVLPPFTQVGPVVVVHAVALHLHDADPAFPVQLWSGPHEVGLPAV